MNIAVQGTSLTLDGKPWLPRGVNISGTEATPSFFCRTSQQFAYECTSLRNFGPKELAAARDFGADTLRIQLSQPSLDPQSPLYDRTYVLEALAAISFARIEGFAVVVMIQDEPISGEPEADEVPLATAETERDLDLINLAFGHDHGVMLELFNEPKLPATPANWTLWANGGSVSWAPPGDAPRVSTAIGMQTLIDHLRGEGSENVLVLDGLAVAHTLDGVPPISDPLNRVVYAVHPYFNGCNDETLWPSQFGSESKRLPVFADEWSAPAGVPLGLGVKGQASRCQPPPPLPSYQEAVDFLNYIRLHHIALAAGAFDVPGFMVQNVPGWTPSNYDHYGSGVPVAKIRHDDAGLLVRKLFRTDYQARLTDADGVTH